MFSTGSIHQGGNIIPIFPAISSSLASHFDLVPAENLDEGNVLFWEGDPARHVFEVLEGLLRIVRMTADGRRVITGFLFAGDVVGVAFKNRHLYTAEAVVRTSVRRYSRSALQKKMENDPALRPTLFARLCDEMEAAQEQVMLLACRNATERVCSFLLMLARKRGGAGRRCTIELPMIRQDIADYLGLSIETVSRTFTRLTNSGVVVANTPHEYDVDIANLARIAGDDDWADNSKSCARHGTGK